MMLYLLPLVAKHNIYVLEVMSVLKQISQMMCCYIVQSTLGNEKNQLVDPLSAQKQNTHIHVINMHVYD